ncbi:hypothetical protein [Inquilinus sp. CAU 1745]|uniref:hypothetical protein n=1 Tax=Inquilinus sp. CAU 1745 TaxID=3140369 RepID=UPI00325BD811
MAFTLTPFLRYALIGAPLALVAGVAFGALVTSATTETIVASVDTDTVQVAQPGGADMPLVLRGGGAKQAPEACAPYQRPVIENGIEQTVSGVACQEENGFWRIID